MGFWSVLGNVGKGLIGLGGGANPDKIADSVLSKIGALGSGGAAGAAGQRISEYPNQLNAARFNREGQDRAQKNAILMQLLNNTQDFQATPGNPVIAAKMGQVSGGLRPSNLTNNSAALMQLLGAPQIEAPNPGSGVMEKTLGGVGLGANILEILSGIKKKQPSPGYGGGTYGDGSGYYGV